MDFEDIKPEVKVQETAKRLEDSDEEEKEVENDRKEYEFI